MADYDLNRPKKASFIKIRLIITALATLCPVVCYIGRQNLAIAMVAMVAQEESPSNTEFGQSNKNINEFININLTNVPSSSNIPDGLPEQTTCPLPTVVREDGKKELAPKIVTFGPKYDWTPSQRSLLFEGFFWTYVICQIPGARVAESLGAKWILFTATVGTSILSFITPLAASWSVYGFVAIRALMGACQAALYPSLYVLCTAWLPPAERSQALPVMIAGAYVGSIITSTTTGYFSEQPAFGWEYAFYMPGLLCAIWSIAWIFLSTSEPGQHKMISLEELDYISTRMEQKKTNLTAPKKSPSWKKIGTSPAIWAMGVAFLASNWSFTITLLLLPTYLNNILMIPPFKNGLINSIIYILFCVSSPIVGAVSTMMIETRAFGLTRIQIRKLFQCTVLFSQAFCFLLIPMVGCDTSTVLGVLYAQIVLFSFVNGGEVQLPSELSLDFAGTLYAIGNCIGSSTGFLVPRVNTLIVTDLYDREQWKIFFYLAASITALGGFLFMLFGRNDLHDFSKDVSDSRVDIYQLSTDRLSNMASTEVKKTVKHETV